MPGNRKKPSVEEKPYYTIVLYQFLASRQLFIWKVISDIHNKVNCIDSLFSGDKFNDSFIDLILFFKVTMQWDAQSTGWIKDFIHVTSK